MLNKFVSVHLGRYNMASKVHYELVSAATFVKSDTFVHVREKWHNIQNQKKFVYCAHL